MNKLSAFYANMSLLMLLAGCVDNEKKSGQLVSSPAKVALQKIKLTQGSPHLDYSGTLEADQTVQVSFAVAGIVSKVNVREGQYVSKGQLLAAIDATDYRSSLAIADAAFEQAEDLYNRSNALYQKGSLPERDYIEIKTKFAQANANKNISAKQVADSRLYSPISGVISAKLVEPGSAASVGPTAFTIIKTDFVYARISVPESEIGVLKQGTKVNVSIPTLADRLPGQIEIINPQADPVTKTYTVKIKIGNASRQLLPGMLAEVRINSKNDLQVIAIPVNAIVRDADELTYVFILNDQNKAIRKRVVISELLDDKIIVNSGLQRGDNLIIEGQNSLSDGQAATTI